MAKRPDPIRNVDRLIELFRTLSDQGVSAAELRRIIATAPRKEENPGGKEEE